jgi:integrase
VKRGVRSQLSVRNYRRAYRLAASRAGLDGLDLHGPHDLRHTFATWLEDGGVPVRVIDELMGHRATPSRRRGGSWERHRGGLPAPDARDAGSRPGRH